MTVLYTALACLAQVWLIGPAIWMTTQNEADRLS